MEPINSFWIHLYSLRERVVTEWIGDQTEVLNLMLAHIKLPYVGTNLSLRRVFVKVRRRISFFVGTEAWWKIFTCNNLIKRGFIIVGWCSMCRCSVETSINDRLHMKCGVCLQIFLGLSGCYWNRSLISYLVGWIGFENIPQIIGI